MTRILEIIGSSWPIAFMVIGLAAAFTVRRTLKQAMDNSHAEKLDRSQGNQAVVVRRNSDEG